MHSVEVLNRTLELAESLGYGIRFEYLGRGAGGACEFAGRRWLFVDLALNPIEQLDQVAEALRQDPRVFTIGLPPAVRDALGIAATERAKSERAKSNSPGSARAA
jgi:hypothetical protein